MSMNWTIYILECADRSLYTGITNDLERRLDLHARGEGAKYTRGRGPFKVLYTEKASDRSTASKRELAIKSLNRLQKLSLISKNAC